jgi:hypothetical protein
MSRCCGYSDTNGLLEAHSNRHDCLPLILLPVAKRCAIATAAATARQLTRGSLRRETNYPERWRLAAIRADGPLLRGRRRPY